MATPRSKTGRLHLADGSVETARFYYGDREAAPPDHTCLDPTNYSTWVEADGTVGIRRGTTISVGASASYSAHYDALDWSN